MTALTLPSPPRAAPWRKAKAIMDVILHLGAHRTGTTSLQHYLACNARRLAAQGVRAWGPRRTRNGLLTGVMPTPGVLPPERQLARARGRLALALETARAEGVQTLLVSDENMIGAARRNLRAGRLYPDAGRRMVRFARAFEGRITRLALSVRAQDAYWASVLAYAVARGHRMPDTDDLDRLVTAPRRWRDVIADVARAVPGAELRILPFEVYGGRPELFGRRVAAGPDWPDAHAREARGASPRLPALRGILAECGRDPARLPAGDGRWRPFDAAQAAALRAAYAEDMAWLRAGADGIARLMEEDRPQQTAPQAPQRSATRGRRDDGQERRMA
ncbi:hypothetical protein [Roseovarius salinarum]|uniref:hypothetical protein n=1 Tax=Roseovarius salinarum TaxID=1981892 RepID=UPI001E4DFF55|nr:hypothetical protein [Roseovarius salinarum]